MSNNRFDHRYNPNWFIDRDASAMYNLAFLYEEQGKVEEAEKYYKQAVEKGHASAMNNLAVLYEEQGKAEEAEEYFKQAVEKGYADAMNNLAVLYFKKHPLLVGERKKK